MSMSITGSIPGQHHDLQTDLSAGEPDPKPSFWGTTDRNLTRVTGDSSGHASLYLHDDKADTVSYTYSQTGQRQSETDTERQAFAGAAVTNYAYDADGSNRHATTGFVRY